VTKTYRGGLSEWRKEGAQKGSKFAKGGKSEILLRGSDGDAVEKKKHSYKDRDES